MKEAASTEQSCSLSDRFRTAVSQLSMPAYARTRADHPTRPDSTHGEGGDIRVEDKGPEQVEPVSHGEGHDGLDARHAVLDGYDGGGGDDHAGLGEETVSAFKRSTFNVQRSELAVVSQFSSPMKIGTGTRTVMPGD